MVAGLALSGCGRDERAAAPASAEEGTPGATATATPPAGVRITSPRPGTTVASVTKVAGQAAPGASVLLRGGCPGAECQAIARADADGEWQARLRLAHPRAAIEAGILGGPVGDRVAVEVRAPERPAPTPRPATEAEAEVTRAPTPAPERVVVVGDSLAVGIQSLLGPLLPGARVSFDAEIGRPLASGMAIVDRADLTSEPTVLALSLFTNDDPTAVEALDAAVRRSVDAVGPSGCVAWATIVRPPLNGVSYDAANRRLAALAAELDRMRLVEWAARVAAAPELLGPDGVHATSAGYQARAALYAQAIRSC